VLLLVLTSCAAGPNTASAAVDHATAPGFLMGLWHGFIAPVTFIVSLFNDNVGLYEVNNAGHLYDLGFVVGAGILFGGSSRII